MHNEKNNKTNNEYEIVDGQQRITTLSLLLIAIYRQLINLGYDKNDDRVVNLRGIFYREDKSTLELSMLNNDNKNYESIIKSTVKNMEEIDGLDNRTLLAKAFNFFDNKLKEDYKDKLDLLNLLKNKIHNLAFTEIVVQNYSDIYLFFEGLNNRGLALTPIDIIKNKFFYYIEEELKKEKGFELENIDEYNHEWINIISNLSEEKTNKNFQIRFFSHFYNAYNNLLKHYLPNKKASLNSLISIYEDLFKQNQIIYKAKGYNYVLLDLLKESSQKYYEFINPEKAKVNMQKLKNSLLDLKHIGFVPSYALLLYAFYNTKYKITENDKIELTNFLVTFATIRNVTNIPPTSKLDNIVVDSIKRINDNYNLKEIKNVFLNSIRDVDDSIVSTFKKALSKDIYNNNKGAIRFILSKFQEYSEENYPRERPRTNYWEREKNKYRFTIEHIHPQTPKTDYDKTVNETERELNENVGRLGNLTLADKSNNTRLGNKSFIEKRDALDEDGRPAGYKNGLWLNNTMKKEVLGKYLDNNYFDNDDWLNKWDLKTIEAREKYLLDKLDEVFDLENFK